jgi:hypothetical protein
MSYKLVTFDGVALPTRNAAQPLDTGDATPGLVAASGGAYDRHGTRQVQPQLRRIVLTAGYTATTDAALRALLDALRAEVGVRGQLVRQRDDAAQQWLYARLLSVSGEWRNEDGRYYEVTCTWETAEPTWRSATATVSARALSSGSQNLSIVVAGSAPVHDAVVQLGAPSGTITLGTVTVAAMGARWTYAGTITGGTVDIDTGAKTVKLGTVDKYSSFALAGTHSAYGWLPMTPGTQTMTLLVNGDGTAIVTHYDRWY